MIAAAIAALSTASVFAAPLNPATATTYLTYYVGGATAQAQAIAVVAPTLFANPADVVKITQSVGNKATAWYGMSLATSAAPSQPLLVVYNNTNGSFAGFNQLINTISPSPLAEAYVLKIGAAGDTLSCNLVTAPYSCTTADASKDKFIQLDLALTDVYPTEAVGGVVKFGQGGNLAQGAITTVPTALEGFGVAVNPLLYKALQASQGLTVGSLLPADQPNVSSADYASLVSEQGAIKTAAQLFQNSDANDIFYERRVDTSGSQAASNIFFLSNVCGTSGFGGALTPVNLGDVSPGAFEVVLNSGTGNVKTALTGTAVVGYGIGVMSLENSPSLTSATSWQWVKLDGVSPNYVNGVADALQRTAVANGAYKFAVEMSASYRNNIDPINKAFNTLMIDGIKNSNLHNLVGVAYLDGVVANQQARYNRSGNNCSPLIDTNY